MIIWFLKYGDRLKLCYMDMDSPVYHIKTKDFYADIVATFQLASVPLDIAPIDLFR